MKNVIAIIAAILITTLGFSQSVQAATKYGRWTAAESYDKVYNTSHPYILTYAIAKDSKYSHLKPYLRIGCVSMRFGDLDAIRSGTIYFRTNGMSVSSYEIFREGSGYDSVYDTFAYGTREEERFWAEYESHFENIIRDSQLYVRFDTYGSYRQTPTFSLSGSSKALEWLNAACKAKRLN